MIEREAGGHVHIAGADAPAVDFEALAALGEDVRPAEARDRVRATALTSRSVPNELMGRRFRPGWGTAGLQITTVVLTAAACAYVMTLVWAMENLSYDVWGAMVVAPVLFLLNLPVARRAASHESDRLMLVIIFGALALKIVGSIIRYWVGNELYNTSDAAVYDEVGERIASYWRATGDFGGANLENRSIPGTGAIYLIIGYFYYLVGPTIVGAFMAFATVAFWGQYLFYRAFCIALPGGDRRRYALLVLFTPALLYWPSSLGKDAIVIGGLGMSTYGMAKWFVGRKRALPPILFGLTMVTFIRPHIAAMVVGAAGVAYLLRRSPKRGPLTPVMRALALAAVPVGFLVLLNFSTSIANEPTSLDSEQLDGAIDAAGGRTTQGGSAFTPVRPTNPVTFVQAALNVLIRPFPFEARNAQSLATAFEGTFIMFLTYRSRDRFRRMPRYLRESPMLIMALIYCFGFVYAFSSFGNFGILARQRTQVLPYLFMFLALPTVPIRTKRHTRGPSVSMARSQPLAPIVLPKAERAEDRTSLHP